MPLGLTPSASSESGTTRCTHFELPARRMHVDLFTIRRPHSKSNLILCQLDETAPILQNHWSDSSHFHIRDMLT